MPVMDQRILEGHLTFCFPAQSMATKYDDWAHYRNQFNSAFGGTKAIDFLHISRGQGWMIEVKDYREHSRTKPTDIADEVACKVRDTLAGLISAKYHATNNEEKVIAEKMLCQEKLRVVLHLEQPQKKSRLRPKAIDPAAVLKKLKQLLRSIDPHPCIVDRHTIKPEIPWNVQG